MKKIKKPSWLEDFKEFAVKGNAMALAVGTIIGGAFSTITKSLTNDIIMPIVNIFLGGTDFTELKVQLPRITPGDPAAVENAQLVLSHNGTDIHQIPITLQPGEMEGGYELPLSQILLPLPEVQVDDTLELQLEVTLSSGTELSAIGISWWRTEAGLDAVVG